MITTYSIIAPNSLNTKGVIYNIGTTGGVAPYRYFITYNGSVIPFGDYIQGFSGTYIIQTVDNVGTQITTSVTLSPTTSDTTYCISCNENKEKEFCTTTSLQSYTVSFTPTYNKWTSFHSYNEVMLTGATTFYLIGNYNEIHKMNVGDRGSYIDATCTSFIDYVQTHDSISNANSLAVLCEVYDNRKVLQTTDSIDYVTVWNQRQCTNRIPVVKGKGGNIRYAEGLFLYNDLRDVARPYTKFIGHILEGFRLLQSGLGVSDNPNYKGVMNSTYHTARVEFENKWNRKILINDIKISTSESSR